jgi:ankyrin repeat protein
MGRDSWLHKKQWLETAKDTALKVHNHLNSFNLSEDDDTILHTAAKSNDVKMIEFLLQRIYPKENDEDEEQPMEASLWSSYSMDVWAPSIHSLFPLKFRQVVKVVLMLGAKRQDGTPYYQVLIALSSPSALYWSISSVRTKSNEMLQQLSKFQDNRSQHLFVDYSQSQ